VNGMKSVPLFGKFNFLRKVQCTPPKTKKKQKKQKDVIRDCVNVPLSWLNNICIYDKKTSKLKLTFDSPQDATFQFSLIVTLKKVGRKIGIKIHEHFGRLRAGAIMDHLMVVEQLKQFQVEYNKYLSYLQILNSFKYNLLHRMDVESNAAIKDIAPVHNEPDVGLYIEPQNQNEENHLYGHSHLYINMIAKELLVIKAELKFWFQKLQYYLYGDSDEGVSFALFSKEIEQYSPESVLTNRIKKMTDEDGKIDMLKSLDLQGC
jgi:hypothetical protein